MGKFKNKRTTKGDGLSTCERVQGTDPRSVQAAGPFAAGRCWGTTGLLATHQDNYPASQRRVQGPTHESG